MLFLREKLYQLDEKWNGMEWNGMEQWDRIRTKLSKLISYFFLYFFLGYMTVEVYLLHPLTARIIKTWHT